MRNRKLWLQINQRFCACCKGTCVVHVVIHYFVRKVMKINNVSFEMWETACISDSTQSFPGANSYYSSLADYGLVNRWIAFPTTDRGKSIYSSWINWANLMSLYESIFYCSTCFECNNIRNMLSNKKTFIKWHQVGSIYSTSKMMHGAKTIRFILVFVWCAPLFLWLQFNRFMRIQTESCNISQYIEASWFGIGLRMANSSLNM